ncbi:hypothetical protein WOA01_15240 [Methylocystis sp. IM2]|uniref:hypothetical protein n=1 Tax=Methylocystis sp. IM2 TaxID=3136563 RepID=UPI0030F873A0
MRRILAEGRDLSRVPRVSSLDDQAHGAPQMALGLIQRRLRLAEPVPLEQQKSQLYASARVLQSRMDLSAAAAR